ncbi:SAM-dependent methyltransferase [bacterium]|nr:SAM-dependent methyltransferase [bacterium]
MTEIREGQSVELLKELHILTQDGKMNQDSRRKLKQVYHLYNFIEPLLKELSENSPTLNLVDHGAGKSYLGFIIYDLFFKNLHNAHVYGIETRNELIEKSQVLQKKLGFKNMSFINSTVKESQSLGELPQTVEMVTALHACDTATDDAISFALQKKAKHIVLIPCCQAEVASYLRQNKKFSLANPMVELYRHGIHTREFGSHLTNILRCLQLESFGYDVTVTELVGFEHSMKNELIIATQKNKHSKNAKERISALLSEFKIQELQNRFYSS